VTPIFGALLLVAAAGGFVYAFRSGGGESEAAGTEPPAKLGKRAKGQGRRPAEPGSAKEAKEQKQKLAMATSAREVHKLLADAVERRMAGTRRKGLAKRLEQAGSQTRPGEWLVITAVVAFVIGVAATVLVNVLVGIVGLAFGLVGSHLLLKRRVSKRQTTFSAQLAETLQLMAGGLRAGLSLAQALNNVASDAPSPSAEEYRRALTEIRLGRDMTEALYAMAERMDSEDFEWVVGAIDINRTTGGDLAVILDRVTDTIRQRDRLRGQVKTLSAEGRLSGIVVGLLPPGVFCFVYVTNHEYMMEFFAKPLGIVLLVAAGFLLTVGSLWLRKLAKPVY
jgi:tight adherence protein B